MKRYLVLLHFAAKISRDDLVTKGAHAVAVARAALQDFEAVFSSDIAFGFAGVSEKEPRELFAHFAKEMRLARQDNLSIIEIGGAVLTSHPGLSAFATRTAFLAFLGAPVRK